jgi:hypothetical protein
MRHARRIWQGSYHDRDTRPDHTQARSQCAGWKETPDIRRH